MEAIDGIGSEVHPAPVQACSSSRTLGYHLARRLVQIGVKDVFSVPGDFNLTLLDHLIAEPELNLIGCFNELNTEYTPDGYAHAKGVWACVVTFTFSGLSVLNAIAIAYSENLPVICIVGGPNSNDYGTNRILHHTIGLPNFTQLIPQLNMETTGGNEPPNYPFSADLFGGWGGSSARPPF